MCFIECQSSFSYMILKVLVSCLFAIYTSSNERHTLPFLSLDISYVNDGQDRKDHDLFLLLSVKKALTNESSNKNLSHINLLEITSNLQYCPRYIEQDGISWSLGVKKVTIRLFSLLPVVMLYESRSPKIQ